MRNKSNKEEKKTFFKETYKAVEVIGKGSYGTVYKAKKEDFDIQSFCAIKQIIIPQAKEDIESLKKEGMNNEKIKKFFYSIVTKWIDEIKLMELFKDSTNIVNIEDYEILEDKKEIKWTINIKMELLSSVDSYIQNNNFTDKDAINMAMDIAHALEDCEKNKVIHRDIKPENIFVNKNKVFKLGDFGVAKKAQSTISTLSKKGTENYMAPEIYKNGKGDKTTDIYSLGIMLYKYFNYNRLPFIPDYPEDIIADNYSEAIEKRIEGEKFKPPINASKEISDIILKMCEYYPNDRYQSAKELLEDLEKTYKNISKPKVIFYLDDKKQEKLLSKNNKESIHDKTVSMFSDSKKTKHDKTISIFTNEEDNKEDKEKIISEIQSEQVKEEIVGKIKTETNVKSKKIIKIIVPIILIIILVFILLNSCGKKEESIIMPSIINYTSEKANKQLSKLGLDIENEYIEVEDDKDVGKVLKQSIKKGTKIKKNSVIKITIGVSQEKVEVIDIVGKQQEEATKEIEKLGLSVKITEKYSDKDEQGKVISQMPTKGEKVAKGSTIEILVSLGKENNNIQEETTKQKEQSGKKQEKNTQSQSNNNQQQNNDSNNTPAQNTPVQQEEKQEEVVIPVRGIYLPGNRKKTINNGFTEQLNIAFSPSDATNISEYENRHVTWSSSNSSVVSVSSTGFVQAKSSGCGTATITAKVDGTSFSNYRVYTILRGGNLVYDINGDGRVNADDAADLIYYSQRGAYNNTTDIYKYDYNCDNKIDTTDSDFILEYFKTHG